MMLVGHSCGACFLLRWLTENTIHIDKLVLVAPWLDPNRRRTSDFYDFEIDPAIADRAGKIHLFESSDEDVEGVLESVATIEKIFPSIIVHRFDNMGHFTIGDMKTEKFPEL